MADPDKEFARLLTIHDRELRRYISLFVSRRDDVEEVSDDEFNPVIDAVHLGVVTREGDLDRVNVDGDDALAGVGKLSIKMSFFRF